MIIQKMVECFRNKLPSIARRKCLDFVHELHIYKCFELLEFLKAFAFGFQCIKPHCSLEIMCDGYEIPCTAHECGPYGPTHVGMQNFQRLGRSPLLFVRKHILMLFAFNIGFAKQ